MKRKFSIQAYNVLVDILRISFRKKFNIWTLQILWAFNEILEKSMIVIGLLYKLVCWWFLFNISLGAATKLYFRMSRKLSQNHYSSSIPMVCHNNCLKLNKKKGWIENHFKNLYKNISATKALKTQRLSTRQLKLPCTYHFNIEITIATKCKSYKIIQPIIILMLMKVEHNETH